MTADETAELLSDIKALFGEIEGTKRMVEFYTRLLKQAVLTHGGILRIDPAMAAAAKVDRRAFFIGGGMVTLEGAEQVNPILPGCPKPLTLEQFMAGVEKDYILEAVRSCGGDRDKAARRLGISVATLYRRLGKHK